MEPLPTEIYQEIVSFQSDATRPIDLSIYRDFKKDTSKDIISKKESDRFLRDIQNLRKLKSNQLHKLNIEINNRNIKKNKKIGIF